MGQITDDFNAINETYLQEVLALDYQKKFKKVYTQLKSLDEKLSEITATQNFTDIPTAVKQALNKNWQAIKAYLAAVEADADIMEMLNWR